jgi:hypothetical protein
MERNQKIALFLLAALPYLASASGIANVMNAMAGLCLGMQSMLPVVCMLMIVIAGVIYAAGQVMGAETRARANVWATAALTGALIAVLIYAIAPQVLNTILTGGSYEAIAPSACSITY